MGKLSQLVDIDILVYAHEFWWFDAYVAFGCATAYDNPPFQCFILEGSSRIFQKGERKKRYEEYSKGCGEGGQERPWGVERIVNKTLVFLLVGLRVFLLPRGNRSDEEKGFHQTRE